MSVKSERSNKSVGHQILKEVEKIKTKSVTFDKKSGYFVSRERLNEIEDILEDLLENQKSSVSTESLLRAHEEINSLKQQNRVAADKLKASQAIEANLNRDIDSLNESLQAQKRLTADEVTRINSEKEKLVIALKQAQLASSELKKIGDTSEVGAKRFAESCAEVTRLNNLLQKANKSVSVEQQKVKDLEKQLQGLKLSVENEKITQQRMKTQSFADAVNLPPPPSVEKPVAKSFIYNKFWSDKNREILDSYLAAKQTDYKDRAAKLIQMAKAVGGGRQNEFKDVSIVLFERIKSVGWRKRAQYAPYVTQLYEAVYTRNMDQLKILKKNLDDFITIDADQLPKDEKFKAESWWDSLRFDFWFFRKSLSVRWREFKSTVGSKVKTLFSHLKFW